MTDKSAFTDDEWKVLTEAPLLVTLALFAAGEHGPISMVKEARHNARQHQVANLDQVIEASLADLGGAATALRKLPNDEAAQVAGWFVDIAKAVAAAAKTVTPAEQETIDKISALFAIPTT